LKFVRLGVKTESGGGANGKIITVVEVENTVAEVQNS
jgi:hypothetical protein